MGWLNQNVFLHLTHNCGMIKPQGGDCNAAYYSDP